MEEICHSFHLYELAKKDLAETAKLYSLRHKKR